MVRQLCDSAAACDALAQVTLLPFARWHPRSTENWCACDPVAVETKLAAVRASEGAADAADREAQAFLDGCHNKCRHGFTLSDMRGYFNTTFLPGAANGGMACANLTRYGLQLNQDGGKTLCNAEPLFRSADCLVVSVGLESRFSRDSKDFEADLLSAFPACKLVGFDGTLSDEAAARVPSTVQLYRKNFDNRTWELPVFSQASRVSLLKIDCESCEYSALPAWVDHVCTEQIIVEIHQHASRWSPRKNIEKRHALLTHLHRRGFRMAFVEPNPYFPSTSGEYTLVRNESCLARADRSKRPELVRTF